MFTIDLWQDYGHQTGYTDLGNNWIGVLCNCPEPTQQNPDLPKLWANKIYKELDMTNYLNEKRPLPVSTQKVLNITENTVSPQTIYPPTGEYWDSIQYTVNVTKKYKLSLFDFILPGVTGVTINRILKNPNQILTITPRDYIILRIEFPDITNNQRVGFSVHWEYVLNGNGNTQFSTNNYAYYFYCTPNNITQIENIVLTYNTYWFVHCYVNPNDETTNNTNGTIFYNEDKIIN